MNDPTVANYIALRFIDCWKLNGCSEDVIEAALGEHYNELMTVDYRVPYQTITDTFRAVAVELQDPLIGLKTGLHHIHSSSGIIGNIANTAKDIRETIKVSLRFIDILTQAYEFSYKEDHYGATMRMSVQKGLDASEYQYDAVLGIFIRFIQFIYGQPSFILYLKQTPDLKTQKKYKELLNADVFFGHEFNGLYIPKDVLNARVSVLDRSHFDRQVKIAEEVYNQVKGTSNIEELVKSKIRHSTYFGNVTLEQVADQLYLTPRTLQNKLKDAATNFRALKEEIRTEIVKEAIGKGESASEIASKAGFTDVAAFYRAFKKRTNVSFKEFVNGGRNLESLPAS